MSRISDFYAAQDRKAFPYRVELTDAGGPLYAGSAPASYNDYNGFTSGRSQQTPLSQREAALHAQTYGGNQSIDWLMDAVNFTVNAVGSADYHFDDGQHQLQVAKSAQDASDTKVAPDDLIKLMAEPNPYMNWVDLCEITLIDFLVVGNAYWVKWQQDGDGKPLALYRMAPQYVKIIPGKFGPDAYTYRLPGDNKDTVFTPDQVLQFKRVNPLDPYYGLGLVRGGARALDMEISLTDTSANYYEKQALPSGVVQTERRVPRDVFNKLKQQLRTFYGGGRNAGQLMVLESGLKYTSISPDAGGAQFEAMGGWSRDRILAMFNMNKRLIGISDGIGLATGEMAQWQLLFDQKTAIPLCKKFSAAISRGLTQPGWGLDICIDYTETQQPDEVLKNAQTVAALPGVRVREVRDAANLPPTGDKSIDDFVLNMPGPNLDANGQGGTPDPNLLGQPGRPPIRNNVPGFGVAKGSAPPRTAQPKSGRTSGKALEVIDSEQLFGPELAPLATHPYYVGFRPEEPRAPRPLHETLAILDQIADQKAMAPANVHVGEIAGVTPPQDTLVSERTSAVDALAAAMQTELSAAAHTLERGLLDASEGKAGSTVYQRIKSAKAWTDFRAKLSSILTNYAEQALSLATMQHAIHGFKQGDSSYADRADEIVNRPDGLAGILATLQSRILKGVLDKQRKGADKGDVDAVIRQAVTDWQNSQAATVAITEATNAYNVGTLDIAEANGYTNVLVSDGEDDDEPCIEANGATWSIEDARANTLEHPHCRRAFVPVSAAEVA